MKENKKINNQYKIINNNINKIINIKLSKININIIISYYIIKALIKLL